LGRVEETEREIVARVPRIPGRVARLVERADLLPPSAAGGELFDPTLALPATVEVLDRQGLLGLRQLVAQQALETAGVAIGVGRAEDHRVSPGLVYGTSPGARCTTPPRASRSDFFTTGPQRGLRPQPKWSVVSGGSGVGRRPPDPEPCPF